MKVLLMNPHVVCFRWRSFLSEQQRGRTAADSFLRPSPGLDPIPPASRCRTSSSCSRWRAANSSPEQAPAAQREARDPLTEGLLFTCRLTRRVPPRRCQVGAGGSSIFKCHPRMSMALGREPRALLAAGVPPRWAASREGLGEILWAWLDRHTDRETDRTQLKQKLVFSVKWDVF